MTPRQPPADDTEPTEPARGAGPEPGLEPGLAARRAVLGSLLAGGATATTWTLATPSPATAAAPDDPSLVVDVTAAPYHAAGDGETDDTEAIRAALAATPERGTCWFPPGTYLVGDDQASVLRPPSGVTLAGPGRDLATIRFAGSSTATRVVDVSGRPDVTVRGLCFDGGAHPTVRSGVFASSLGSQKNLRVEQCRFLAFSPTDAVTTQAAVYTWTSNGVDVLDNEFVHCGRAVTIDQPDGAVRVVGNRIGATSGIMATGILVRRASGSSAGRVLVQGNDVRGADRDPSGRGADGHAIAVFRCRDVHVSDNFCAGSKRGILVSNGAFGTVVKGNTCLANTDAGIRVEPEISSKDISTGTAGVPRGVVVIGNTCRDNRAYGQLGPANSGIGITLSYAAGSTVSGNVCHDNTGDGIVCDSDRVTIVGNVSFNNFQGYTRNPSSGRRAGIRVYAGTGCTIVGNHCFDNRDQPRQDFGLSLSGAGTWHVVHANNFTGNAVGEVHGRERIREGFFGATPVPRPSAPPPAVGTDAATINQLVQGLKDLGLLE